MANVIPIGRHWSGPTLVDLSKVTSSLSRHELLALSPRSGVNYGIATQAILEKASTARPDPTREIVLAHDEVNREQRVSRKSARMYYEKKGLTGLSSELLLEVLLKQPKLLNTGHYSVFVGTEGDCFTINVTRNGTELSTNVERLLPGVFVYHREMWLMQRAVHSEYQG